MNQAWVCPPIDTAPKSCLHCGAPVSSRAKEQFCCQGCSSVYALLQERGLQTFYVLRNRSARPHEPISTPSATEKFAYLDDPEFLKEYADESGLQMRFYLEGVHCAACVWLTEKLPKFAQGVTSLKLDLSSSVATVQLDSGGRFSSAARELARLGYRPHPVKHGESDELQKKENRRHLIQLGIAGMVSGNIMLLAVSLYAGANGTMAETFRWISFFLFLPVLFYCANPFYRSAWAALRKKQVSVDVPIVLGLLVGTTASIANLFRGAEHIYFDSISTLIFLLLATRYLLKKVTQHSLKASQVLHFMVPSKARRFNPDSSNWEEVRTDALMKGDLIRVLPGECFPVDGEVVQGESGVNLALLTGEVLPQAIRPGSRVNAGTWNQHAPLKVNVLAAGTGTRLGKILLAMEQGLDAKAPIVSQLDRVGQWFVTAALLLIGVGFLLGLPHGLHEAVNRAVAVAIIVCPCTFALATPLAFSLATGRAAKNGILIKGAEFIERLSHIDTVFFDKTGTLTFGELEVTNWTELEPGALRALLALESHSPHPIARAILRHFQATSRLPKVEGYLERPGFGISGRVDGVLFELGSSPIGSASNGKTEGLSGGVISRVSVLREGKLVGVVTLSDIIRPDSKQRIEELRRLGLKVHIISGDSSQTVSLVAQALEIAKSDSVSQATPEMKSLQIMASPKGLMVGDGANDAIALASAYASVAVQGGMEMSIRAAGAYSTKPGIGSIPALIIIARQTMRVIRRNLGFAVLYNVIGIAAALSGHLNPLFAAVLMPVSALTVFLSTIIGTKSLRQVRS